MARFRDGMKAATSGRVMEGLRIRDVLEELLERLVGVWLDEGGRGRWGGRKGCPKLIAPLEKLLHRGFTKLHEWLL